MAKLPYEPRTEGGEEGAVWVHMCTWGMQCSQQMEQQLQMPENEGTGWYDCPRASS